ncbi:DUF433 domain-containing protein [Candidatus Parcubacteria bacterium]|nr:MAG: DUF433 domain-containing protein [Candidatus Parcubacteria bacterium]
MLGFDRITFDPNGMGMEEIIAAYPYLGPEDIRQALQYAAWAAEGGNLL